MATTDGENAIVSEIQDLRHTMTAIEGILRDILQELRDANEKED